MKFKIQGKIIGSFLLIILSSILIFTISIQRNIQNHFNQYCQIESCQMNTESPTMSPMESRWTENQSSFLNAVQNSLIWTSLGTLLIAILLSILLSGRISRPICEMIRTTQEIAKGNYSKRIQVRGNDEIADLGTSLNAMAESLNKIEQLRRDLITNFSHEMATPLTTINGYIEAMEDGLVTEEEKKKKILSTLKTETNRLICMIKDLRELSLIESGHFRINLSPVSLYPMLEKIVHSIEVLFQEKNITLSLDCEGDSPHISADHIRFPQIILNLLTNALHYTKEGGKVVVQSKTCSKSKVEIIIQDSGIGIDEKDLPHIFERFYRTEASRSRKTGGSGIGLSIVQDLVNLHHGTITVESKVGKGTTFHLIFPC